MSDYRLKRVSGRPNWHIVWTEGRKTKRHSTGTENKVEAQAALEDFGLARPIGNPVSLVTVCDCVDAYLEDCAEREIASLDVQLYRAKPIKKRFRDCLPRHLSRDKIKAYQKYRMENCDLSPSTVRDELGLLKAALNFAVRDGRIDKFPYIELPPPSPPKDRFLTEKEARKLIRQATAFHVRLFIYLGLYTGQRSISILDLTWDRVDMEMGRINFNRPGQKRKNKKRSVVPITIPLRPILERARKRAESEYVVEWGGRQVNSIKKSIRRTADKAGLHGVSAHTLRHTAATWMAKEGVPMWEIAGMLGHSNSKITEQVYAKHAPEYLGTAAGALASISLVPRPRRLKRHRGGIKPEKAA